MGAVRLSSAFIGNDQRNLAAAVLAVDAEVVIESEDGGIVMKFGEADEGCVGEGHGKVGVFFDQRNEGLMMFLYIKSNKNHAIDKEFKERCQ